MPDSRTPPGLRAADDPGRSPPPALGSSVDHGPGGVSPTVAPDLWAEIVREADDRGLDPSVFLGWLIRPALNALARTREEVGDRPVEMLDTRDRRV